MTTAEAEMTPARVRAQLGFSRPDQVVDDYDNRGLKRAITRPLDTTFDTQFERRECELTDWSLQGRSSLDLLSMGFEALDLSPHRALQALLADIRAAAHITDEQARRLRSYLTGSVFPLSGGKCLKFLNIAPEGLIMRQGGPNGRKLDGEMSQMNNHGVAQAIHGDQDVHGTPLKQLMRGRAPRFFRHQSPDGGNRFSPMVLVNVWIPLQQITQPLTLMDRRSLQGREHMLRYALPTETFLDRDEDMRFNDIWSLLHNEQQRWYFNSDMSHDQAYAFDTLGEPHGATTLPGETTVEYYYLALQQQLEQVRSGEPATAPTGTAPVLPEDTTAALRQAVDSLQSLCGAPPAAAAGDDARAAWIAAAEQAIDRVVRKSLEMRVVAVLLPNLWPFNRNALT